MEAVARETAWLGADADIRERRFAARRTLPMCETAFADPTSRVRMG